MTDIDTRTASAVPPLTGFGTAPVTCPCGATFTGLWTDPGAETEQACPDCGHVTLARWSGWTAHPETVTVDRGSVQATSAPAALRWQTVTAALPARTVNPWDFSHAPRSYVSRAAYTPA